MQKHWQCTTTATTQTGAPTTTARSAGRRWALASWARTFLHAATSAPPEPGQRSSVCCRRGRDTGKTGRSRMHVALAATTWTGLRMRTAGKTPTFSSVCARSSCASSATGAFRREPRRDRQKLTMNGWWRDGGGMADETMGRMNTLVHVAHPRTTAWAAASTASTAHSVRPAAPSGRAQEPRTHAGWVESRWAGFCWAGLGFAGRVLWGRAGLPELPLPRH